MNEKLREPIEQAPVEQHNEQLNKEPFAWEFSFNREERRRLNPTDRITTNMYRADGDYSGDFTEERLALRASTRGSDKRKAMGLEASYNSLALAKHFNVIPAIEELEESVVAPLEQQDKDTRTSKLEVRIGQAEELKTQAAREKRLAELNKKIAELDEVIAKRRQTTEAKAQEKLEEKYGPSWVARHAKFTKEQGAPSSGVAKAAGSLATKNLITPITETEEDVIEAPKVEVVQRGSIEESNREASGTDANQMDINHLANIGSGRMFGSSVKRNERINKWQEQQDAAKDIEGVEVERFDDVEVSKDAIARSEAQTPISELDFMNDQESQPKKRNFFKRMNDKVRDLSLGTAVKLTSRSAERSEKEKMSRKKKVAIVLAGAVAVGTALYLANQGDDHSKNFLSDLWPFGGNGGGTEHANDVANQTQVPSGAEHGTMFGPDMPDTSSIQPDQPITPVDAAPHAPAVETFRGHEVQNIKMESGGNIWNHEAALVDIAHPDWTDAQKLAETDRLKDLALKANRLTEYSATKVQVAQGLKLIKPL